MTTATTTPANRTRRTADGDLLEIVSLKRYGTSGWQWTIRRTTPDGDVEQWTRRTNGAGNGLWEDDKQLFGGGTSQFWLPADRQGAIRYLLRDR